MNWFQVVILSIVQGLTEFLPVSSFGHLVILQNFFAFSSPPVLFDILLHVGTLGAIIFYFRNNLAKIVSGLFKGENESLRIIWLVLVGTLPAVLVGGFFSQKIELAFDSFLVVGLSFILTALLLFSTKMIKNSSKNLSQLNFKSAIFVGIFQAIAILPGISRSGSTIVAGLWSGLDKETAFRFSFYLAVPAILGALILKSNELLISSTDELFYGLAGLLIAGVVGYFALRVLENVLRSARFWYFGLYCLLLGILLLI